MGRQVGVTGMGGVPDVGQIRFQQQMMGNFMQFGNILLNMMNGVSLVLLHNYRELRVANALYMISNPSDLFLDSPDKQAKALEVVGSWFSNEPQVQGEETDGEPIPGEQNKELAETKGTNESPS